MPLILPRLVPRNNNPGCDRLRHGSLFICQRQRHAGGGEQATDLHGLGGLQGALLADSAADVPQGGAELTRAEYQRLLEAAQARDDARLLLLLETLCVTGIRVSELQYITMEVARNGVAEIALKGKIRTILLPTKLCHKLLKYAKRGTSARGRYSSRETETDCQEIFVWPEMKKLCESAGVARSKVFPPQPAGAARPDVLRRLPGRGTFGGRAGSQQHRDAPPLSPAILYFKRQVNSDNLPHSSHKNQSIFVLSGR